MIQTSEVREIFSGHSLLKDVGQVPKGHIRLETGFRYPDGGSIELYLIEDQPLLKKWKLTDFGETMGWLHDVQIKPWLSRKRKGFVEDVLKAYGVTQEGGTLVIYIDSQKDLPDALVRLSQACLRVADLVFTRRSSLQGAFQEQVEEVLADLELDYQPNAELIGRYGKPVRVDYLVSGHRTKSAILTLSTGNPSQAHNLSNEIFRRWYDLVKTPERTEQRVTVYDDSQRSYRDDDLDRLGDVSTVVPLSDRQAMQDMLMAA